MKSALKLLNQMYGFDRSTNIKVITATDRSDTLDPTLLRPGRFDKRIEFLIPDRRWKRLIFFAIVAEMNLSDERDLEDCVARSGKLSWKILERATRNIPRRMRQSSSSTDSTINTTGRYTT